MSYFLTIRDKFIVIGSIILVLLLAFNIFLLTMIDRLADLPIQIIDHPLQVSNAAYFANVEVLRMQKDLERILLVEEDYEVSILIDKIRVAEGQVYVALDIIAYDILGERGQLLQNDARILFDDWKIIRTSIIEAVRHDKRDEALELLKNEGAEHADVLERKLVELNQYARKKATEFQNDVIDLENSLRNTAIIGMILVIICILISIIWISISVLSSIHSLSVQLGEIVDSGELKEVHLDGNDELVELSTVFNDLIVSLDRQIWLKEGNKRLYSILNSTGEVDEVVEQFINEMKDYSDMISIAYYELENESLVIKSVVNRLSFMATSYAYGDGIIGESFKSKEMKILDYGNLTTNNLSDLPYQVIMANPVMNGDEVYGVLVFVYGSSIIPQVYEYLQNAMIDFSLYINSAAQRQQIDILFMESVKKNDQLKIRQKDLEESNKYRSQFFANVSHELKTPLNSIIILSRLLQSKTGDCYGSEDFEKIVVINKAANELLLIIDDILDLSRIESGRVELNEGYFMIADLFKDLEDLYSPQFEDHELEASFDINCNYKLYGDREKIYHILSNLISNAIKFTHEGYIKIRVDYDENDRLPLLMSVEDSGIGIDAHKTEVIFEEFVQSDGSINRTYGGTGLGLAICKSYAELLGGQMRVKSEKGQGSRFTLALPQKYTIEKTNYENNIIPSAVESSDDLSDKMLSLEDKSILVCDDEPFNLFALASVLEEIGVTPYTTLDVNEALEVYSNHKIDMIIMDLMMPEIDGFMALEIFKKAHEFEDVSVVILTAAELSETDLKRIEKNNYLVLKKPVKPNDIYKMLNSHLI